MVEDGLPGGGASAPASVWRRSVCVCGGGGGSILGWREHLEVEPLPGGRGGGGGGCCLGVERGPLSRGGGSV